MRSMRRGTIFPLLFVLISAAIVAASQFVQNQPSLILTLAVDPLAEAWVRQMAQDFNATQPTTANLRRVEIAVQVVNDHEVWRDRGLWNTTNHPTAWLPSTSVAVSYAQQANAAAQFETIAASVARTPLIFGSYTSRARVLNDIPARLSWDDIQRGAEVANWEALGGLPEWEDFINLAFPPPDSSITGLAVVFASAADYRDSAALNSGSFAQGFQDWFTPIINAVPNFNTIGADVAVFMARGPETASAGIAPEVRWLNGLEAIQREENITFSYPEYIFMFDFPLVIWSDTETTTDERDAIRAFGDYLLSDAAQTDAMRRGLRPANGAPTNAQTIFAQAQRNGILFEPPFDQLVEAPPLNDTRALLSWFARARGS